MRPKSIFSRLFSTAFIILLSWPGAARGEWERQRMNPQDEQKGFLDVSVVSSSFAVAAGMVKQGGQDAAAVFITRDGINWAASSPQTAGGPFDFHIYMSVWFADESLGYVGGLGEIWVTRDGGSSWTRVGLGGLAGGRAINGMTGLRPAGPAYAVTSTGQVLRSLDDGENWPELAVPLAGASLNGVVFLDESHGFVYSGTALTDEESGEVTGYEGGGFALTDDGGETWQVVFSGEARKVVSARFIDARRGWMVSRNLSGAIVERTVDGGQTWEMMPVPGESTGGEVRGFADIFFFDGCEGVILGAVGQNDWGAVWRTTDGGDTWVEHDREFLRLGQFMGFPIEAGMVRFDFADRTVGWATGSYETIFRYDADEDPPACDDGGGGEGGSGGDDGGRCSCRAAGRVRGWGGGVAVFALIFVALWLTRRRWKS